MKEICILLQARLLDGGWALENGIDLRAQFGGIGEEIAATAEGGKASDGLGLRVFRESADEVLRSLAHDF